MVWTECIIITSDEVRLQFHDTSTLRCGQSEAKTVSDGR